MRGFGPAQRGKERGVSSPHVEGKDVGFRPHIKVAGPGRSPARRRREKEKEKTLDSRLLMSRMTEGERWRGERYETFSDGVVLTRGPGRC